MTGSGPWCTTHRMNSLTVADRWELAAYRVSGKWFDGQWQTPAIDLVTEVDQQQTASP